MDRTNSRFKVIDISVTSAPIEIASMQLAVLNNDYVLRKFVISGDYAYLAYGLEGLQIIDISVPEQPNILSVFQTPLEYRIMAVVVSGHLAYLTVQGNPQKLYIVDVSDPTGPTTVGSANLTGNCYHLAISGSTCYAAYWTGHTVIVDVADPTNPQVIGILPYNDGNITDMVVFGDYLYEGRENYGYDLTYVAAPEPMVPISTLPTSGSSQSVVVSTERDGLAYVADGDGGLKIIDFLDPLVPVIVDSVATPGYAWDVALYGNHAYIADGDSGLQIVDISTPRAKSPEIIGFVDTPGNAVDVSLEGTMVYIADSEAGFRVINASNPLSPQIVGAVQDSLTLCQSVDISGIYCYVADGIEGFKSINVSDPDNPWIVGGVKGRSWGNATNVKIQGNTAYVTDSDNGLHVIDITVPDSPLEVGHTETEGQAMHVSVSGSYAYIADSGSGMQLIDVADSFNPTIIGSVDLPENALCTFATNELVFVAAANGGLIICPSQCGTSDEVIAAFSLNLPPGVFYPAVVSFTNETDGYFQNCYWDFGDGVGTSTAVNPTYYYATPGDFTISLTVSGSGNSSTITHDIRLLAAEPVIASVTDVPEDQGGFVFVNFTRSGHDDTLPGRSEMYTIQRQYNDQWVTVATSGAYGDHTYSVLAATQGDGSESWTTSFRVIAHMDEGLWIGPAVSGFSEDNIAPAVPLNIVWLEGGDLGWDQVPDPDFAYYQIYGSPSNSFTESEPVGATIETSYPAPTGEYPWFFISAVDDYGNHSTPVLSPDFTSAVPTLITAVSLSSAAPNPFNPSTRIEYALPKTGKVHLAVYDLSGHLVKTLVNEVIETGIHSINWHGKDEANRGVSAGAYFYRLEAGGDVIIRRMMLIK